MMSRSILIIDAYFCIKSSYSVNHIMLKGGEFCGKNI